VSPAERKREALALLERLREVLKKEAALLGEEEAEQLAETTEEADLLLQELQELFREVPGLREEKEVQRRLQEVNCLRSENLQLARRRREDLLHKLRYVRRGKKAVRAYASSQGESRSEKFVWKKS